MSEPSPVEVCPVCHDDHDWRRHSTCYPRYLERQLAESRSALEQVKGLAQKVVEAEDATETFEAGCNCENQTAGYVCGEPGPCGWRRHIPTYDIKTAVALEAAIDELAAALAPTTSQEEGGS